jgi:hypothetical protein
MDPMCCDEMVCDIGYALANNKLNDRLVDLPRFSALFERILCDR